MFLALRRRYRPVIYKLFAALVISGAVFLTVHIVRDTNNEKNGPVLELRDTASGRVYAKWSLDQKGEFAVEFIHSVNQSPVREIFAIEEKMIQARQVRFSSFGAGMQSDLDEGQTLSRDGDSLIISGFNTSFKELNYIVGTVSDHLLFVNGETVSLRSLCGKNAHVTMRIE